MESKRKLVIHYFVVTLLGLLTSSVVVIAATPLAQLQGGTKLNAADLNAIIDEINAPTAKTIPDTILCSKTGTTPDGGGAFTLNFVDGECVVDLGDNTYQNIMPDSRYHGVASQINFCTGFVNFKVNQAPSPGLYIWENLSAANAGCNSYVVTILYIRFV